MKLFEVQAPQHNWFKAKNFQESNQYILDIREATRPSKAYIETYMQARCNFVYYIFVNELGQYT